MNEQNNYDLREILAHFSVFLIKKGKNKMEDIKDLSQRERVKTILEDKNDE